ncbi:MAG: hypothetical protein Q7J08_08095 [Methanocorpusculum sp.]|uniref:hypothetical protein n=1 Tax=Methanocorpusculum sp. TaxID=2058474 RepID=UPI002725755E|nr:hypothetical protein [Methanocorpusculum sp.]MDO9523652.1 hypothetical protein [Methanocorpusculum sp.]
MVMFSPSLTEFLVFDLEAFVPPADRRKRTGASLAVNAFREGHTLLGGVVYGSRPIAGEVVHNYTHHWMWREGGEREVVTSLYQVFANMWANVKDKKMIQADPVVCGVGISTFDMPFLLAKCLQYQVAPLEEIYNTIGKCRVVDLSVAGIGFIPTQNPILHPCSHNQLADALLPERERKPTGKKVWEMMDAKDYGAVERRCESEVREMVEIANRMLLSCRYPRNTV